MKRPTRLRQTRPLRVRPTRPTRPTPPPRRAAAGFTLIEAGVVLAVLAVVVGLAAPSLRGMVEMRRLQGAASLLATDLRLARAEAGARQMPIRFSVRPLAGGSCYVIHTGAPGACSCGVDDGPAPCTSGATSIRTVRFGRDDGVALASNVASMLFDPARSTTTPTGTIRLVGRSGRAIHQVVNVLGRVRTCSPDGAATGVRPC